MNAIQSIGLFLFIGGSFARLEAKIDGESAGWVEWLGIAAGGFVFLLGSAIE